MTKILIAAALALSSCSAPEETAEPQMVVDVKTAQASLQDVEVTVTAPAAIYPISQAKVASKVTAPIARLAVGKGDRVSKGQTLAWLRSEDLEAQLSDAKAQISDAEANFEKVSAGTLPTEVERAQGEVDRTDAALAEAKQIYERRQALVKEGALPERELLLAKTQYEQAQAASRVAKSSLELLTGKSRAQDIRSAQSRLDQAQAGLELIQAQLDFARVNSPSRGVVTEQFLYPGDMARPDNPIFTVMDLSTAVARGQFPEENTAGLKVGEACRFSGVDVPDAVRTGKITVVSQAVDPLRRTVEAWCEIKNDDGALKAGAFGHMIAVIGVHSSVVTVPLAAVEFAPDRNSGVVWTVSPDNHAHENQITPGVVTPDIVEVKTGISSGDTVVVEGGYGLSDGVEVRRAEPGK